MADSGWITTESGSHILLKDGKVSSGAGGSLKGKSMPYASSVKPASKSSSSSGKSSSGKSGLTARSAKEFSSAASNIYKAQGKTDWEDNPYSPQGLDAKQYFGSTQSFAMNNSLRTGKKPDKRTKEALERFDKAFKTGAVDVPEGTTLHRGVSGAFAEQLSKMKPGESFKDKGYFSTAGTEKSASDFGQVMMKIKTKGSQKAMLHKAESEVLFAPGRKITVTGSKKSGNKTIVEVELSE